MKVNTTKCHLLLNKQKQNVPKIGKFSIENSCSERLLGIDFDRKLKISTRIEDIY